MARFDFAGTARAVEAWGVRQEKWLAGALMLWPIARQLGDLRQRFDLLRYQLDLDFSMDTLRRLDRRVGIAAGILLATIEGKQTH